MEVFRKYWPKYSSEFAGEKIESRKIVDFFYVLPEPLGYGENTKKQFIAKEVMNMALYGDGQGYLYFNEVLYAAMKKSFWNKIKNADSAE